jgi:hypothetical protein
MRAVEAVEGREAGSLLRTLHQGDEDRWSGSDYRTEIRDEVQQPGDKAEKDR